VAAALNMQRQKHNSVSNQFSEWTSCCN